MIKINLQYKFVFLVLIVLLSTATANELYVINLVDGSKIYTVDFVKNNNTYSYTSENGLPGFVATDQVLSVAEANKKQRAKELTVEKKSTNSKFKESDFLFQYKPKTIPYKDIVIAGVNKIHNDDKRCKKIDPGSAFISPTKGSKDNPVFFVTCGDGLESVNVFFSKSDIMDDITFNAPEHIDHLSAIDICESYAKSKSTHPSTVIFSRVSSLNVRDTLNGNTEIKSTFTAKNSFGLELQYKISCLLNPNGLIEASISE